MSETTSAPVLLTVREFCNRHSWATAGGLRHVLFFRETNGLEASGAIVRFGRRLLIDQAKFFRWLEADGRNLTSGGPEPKRAA